MKLLGWLALGAGIFFIDSAVHNRGPLAALKLVLANGSDIANLPAGSTIPTIQQPKA